MKKQYSIHIKGSVPELVKDCTFTKFEYTDLKFDYGAINFKGTEQQLEEVLNYFVEQGHGHFKVIGVHDEETENYYKQLLTNTN